MNPDKDNSSLNYRSGLADLDEWLNKFSRHLKVEPGNNEIKYPHNFASGFAKVNTIEQGLSYGIVDYDLNTDFIFNREPSDKFYLIIYFYQYTNIKKLFVSIDDDIIADTDENSFSAILMTNSLTHQTLELNKGTNVKGLTIQLAEEWLKEKIQDPGTFLHAMFKEKKVFRHFLNAKAKKLLNQIFSHNSESVAPLLYINTRVLRLLEGFLEDMLRMNLAEFSGGLSSKDFQSVSKIERILLENYASDFPKIENLARMALMSETKLKNIFKKAFGMGLYEYYQKNRMHKAKEFLSTKRYSVSEVGTMVGYVNLSNFSNAFKKEFGHLPKNYSKIA